MIENFDLKQRIRSKVKQFTKEEFFVFCENNKINIFLTNLVNIKFLKLKREINRIIDTHIKKSLELNFYDIKQYSTKLKIFQYHYKEEEEKIEERKKKAGIKKLYSDFFKEMNAQFFYWEKSKYVYSIKEYIFFPLTKKAYNRSTKEWFHIETLINKMKKNKNKYKNE